MADKDEKVETTTTEENAAEEIETTEPVEELDYDKEFQEQLDKFETAEKNRKGYEQRKAAEATQPEEGVVTQEGVNAMVSEALKQAIPALQTSLVEDQVETVLNEIAKNDAEKKLIRFHFENSVGLNGTIRERLENAKLIANKKTILKTQREMATALHNRQGISSTGQGHSTDGPEVKDSFFTKEQLAELKKRGYSDEKIERLKVNMRNRIN